MKRIILFFLLVLRFPDPLELQGQTMRFDRYSVEEGLQNNIVFSVAQDKKGLMWFATSTGIDRFDGSQFLHYPLPLKNGAFTAYAQVPFILTDSSKRVWAATASNIYQYDPLLDVFTLPKSVNDWIEKGHTVTFFATGDKGHCLLVGNNNGFFVYYPGTGRMIATEGPAFYCRFVFQDDKGVIWVGTNKGLRRFLVHEDRLKELSINNPVLDPVLKQPVNGISQDARHRYWIITANMGLLVYDEQEKSLRSVSLPRSSFHAYAIKDVYHDAVSKNSYISLDGGGLTLVDSDLHVVTGYQTNEDDNTSLSNNAAYDIFSDSYNRIWVTTYGGGINVTKPEGQPFINFQHEINNPNSLGNNAAKAVTEDAQGRIWFGTRKGISRWDPSSRSWAHFNEDNRAPGFSSDNILALEKGEGSYIWAGTYGGGLLRIDANTGQTVHYMTGEDISTIGTDNVYAILPDDSQRIWAGGIRGPLSFLDTRSGRFSRIKTPVSSINCLVQDSRKRILAGTEKGIFVVNGDSLVNLFPGLVTEKVQAILEYKPGLFWIGTLGNGIIVLEEGKGVQKNIHASDGLPADFIGGFVLEKDGDVWVGTSKGIAHCQVDPFAITTYSKADGMAGSQVNYGAVCRTTRGELIFGTTDGFSMLKPEAIKTKGYKPVILFTGLTVNNKKVTPGEKDSPLKVQLDETGTLRLKHYQNSITVDFVNTSPAISGKHLYSWKLQGFDRDWSRLSTTPMAVYTNLNPGHYTLLVKTIGKGQSEEPVVRKLDIVISAPFWRTPLAYTLYAVLLAAAIYIYYNFHRIRNARKKFAERLRLNTSISHEIRTPLTLIKGPVGSLAADPDLSPEQLGNLQLAQRNIEKLEKIISQFIDFQQSGTGQMPMQVRKADIVALADEVASSFIPLMKEKNIHFTFRKPAEAVQLLFDRDKMEKVFNNLFSNAVKYTPEGRDISLDITRDARMVTITVSDRGIGIPARQQHLLFKGYFRADNTMNLKETGSGIGLSVARELVEMHHGKLTFSSEHGKGSTFTIKLPLHNDFLKSYLVQPEFSAGAATGLPALVAGTAPRTANKTLVVAEDNDELRTYLQQQLEAEGYRVLTAPHGGEAWDLIRKQKPDLLITDVMMPVMNGFQLCEKVKKDIQTCHIPVIMLTAIHDRDYLLEGYRTGADDYVRKPFELSYMVARIENLLLNRTRFRNKIMSVFEQEEKVVGEDQELTWLKEVTGQIAEHLDDPDFSVEKLCTLVALSRSVLFRRFKSITGESPQHYIQKMRLRRSVELLQKGSYNINEVAFECGFSDPRYFSTAFRKHYGKSPTEYLRDLAG